ncbi:lysine biosynthesis protein LysW [Patescibacteria group bacterium]|nr:lysine biosynthesis protein LysW [Patescibacteria group bacterium]
MTNVQDQIICPDCKAEINHPEKLEVGDIVECQECGTEVEITSLEPLVYREIMETK